ncbi:MAG: acyl-CoA carboxylase subunit beta [Planctomycetota bacterium]
MPINPLRSTNEEFQQAEKDIKLGGGLKAIERQHNRGRLTARERIDALLDKPADFFELGLWAAHNMYTEHGGSPSAGVVTGIGLVEERRCMIIANDATVKAGAFFPMTCKKIIRAQNVALKARMPLLYLVDSAGVFLPLQEDVFPDTDDFGRIFYLNSLISAQGIPQIAAIMGFCVAGGGYLPVLCDTLLMTEGSGLYLAGPALVKAAIGQEVSDEELGGAQMHAEISGTIDFKEPNDEACIKRIRSLVAKHEGMAVEEDDNPAIPPTARDQNDAYDIITTSATGQYDTRDIIHTFVDAKADDPKEPDFDEYKADYGKSIVTGYARLSGIACGIVANQKLATQRKMPGGFEGPNFSVNMPGVIYDDGADKAARFIMDCNQRKVPIIFLHDTSGFMVGRDSEQGGIIRSGAKMVNTMSNCVVPKIVLVVGGSYGAGNYAMCGRAFDPFLTLAWPATNLAVMSAASASGTLAMIEERSRQRKGEEIDQQTHEEILQAVRDSYNEQQDIRHGAARGWLDRIIEPHRTREELTQALKAAQGVDTSADFKTGVLQV